MMRLLLVLLLLAAPLRSEPLPGVPLDGTSYLLTRGSITAPDLRYVPPEIACPYMLDLRWGRCDGVQAMFTGMEGRVRHLAVFEPTWPGRIPDLTWDDAYALEMAMRLDGPLARHAAAMSASGPRPMVHLGHRIGAMFDRETPALVFDTQWRIAGAAVTMIHIYRLDRRGTVYMRLRPTSGDMPDEDLRNLVRDVIAAYAPLPGEGYDDWVEGDAVLEGGSVAGLYVEAASTGLAMQRPKTLLGAVWAIARTVLGD